MSGRRRATTRGVLLLFACIVFVVGSVSVFGFLRAELRRDALHDAAINADLLIARNLATHEYFTAELKPEVFADLEGRLDSEVFAPEWMSSTYAVREMMRRTDPFLGEYSYKEAAIDARSPQNEADEFEKVFLERLAANPKLQKDSGVRIVDGLPMFYLMRLGEMVAEECLQCHSTPDQAPVGLVEIYGPTRSFGRSVGEVASALSVEVPLGLAYRRADDLVIKLFVILVGVYLILLAALFVFVSRYLIHPLAMAQDAAIDIVEHRRPLRAGVPAAGTSEVHSMATAFNSLADDLATRVEELEKANAEVVDANNAKDRFLANLSHELRTPLNSVIGFAGVLGQGLAGPVNPEQVRQLDMISTSGRHLLELLQEILDFTKLRSGTAGVEVKEFDPRNAVSRVCDALRVEAARKQIELVYDADAGECSAKTDRLKFEQILLNLVGNAIKFTDVGGVGVYLTHEGAEIVVRVKDSGPGVPAEDLLRVFDEFYQAGTSASLKPTGTGLGLPISRSLAQLLGGDVSIESTGPEGSVFMLRIPCEYDDSQAYQ
ncbi:MAG: DUF3365 domain-containing protein [Coriobacteriia bacterium]|nr:DUF3365 domain-containing protein [Coriobacteriia bacterium]